MQTVRQLICYSLGLLKRQQQSTSRDDAAVTVMTKNSFMVVLFHALNIVRNKTKKNFSHGKMFISLLDELRHVRNYSSADTLHPISD